MSEAASARGIWDTELYLSGNDLHRMREGNTSYTACTAYDDETRVFKIWGWGGGGVMWYVGGLNWGFWSFTFFSITSLCYLFHFWMLTCPGMGVGAVKQNQADRSIARNFDRLIQPNYTRSYPHDCALSSILACPFSHICTISSEVLKTSQIHVLRSRLAVFHA